MKSLASKVQRFLVSEDGPTAVEYAVMLALIVIVCSPAIQNIGNNASGSNNAVLVTGSGSVWTNTGTVSVGNAAPFNTLIVSNGGQVAGNVGRLGSAITCDTRGGSGVGPAVIRYCFR